MSKMNITLDEIRSKAPEGATHYYSNAHIVAYYFYSSDVKMWFVWDKHHEFWTSKCFTYRESDIKPLN